MKKLKQIAALLQMSLTGIPQRLGASAVTVIGIACVVGVLVAMLSMGIGMRQIFLQNARADRAVVLSHGAVSTNASSLSKETIFSIADMPGIKKGADGKPLAAAESGNISNARRKRDNGRATLVINGVTPQYTNVYPELHLTAGRMFQPGLREVVVGKSEHETIKGLEIGDSVRFRGSDWQVVGHYDAGRNLNLNLIADADTIMSAAASSNYNQLTVVLESPAAFATLQAAIKANPSVDVDLKHEADLMKEEGKQLSGILDFVSYFVGVVMAIGATLGAINAMYSVVDSRKREIATLRAIGFGNFPIIVSVLVETLLLALPGALLGILIAWLLFNGNTVSPLGISFKLVVTPLLAAAGVAWAVVMGLAGGLWPAIRAARIPVATALRAT